MYIEPNLGWNSDSYFNFEDMNRIEHNISETYIKLLEFNPNAIIGDVVTNRTITTIDFAEDLNRIESNIQLLADYFHHPPGWQTTKTDWVSGAIFDYNDAMRMEKNVDLIYQLLSKTQDNYNYCGTFRCGEFLEVA